MRTTIRSFLLMMFLSVMFLFPTLAFAELRLGFVNMRKAMSRVEEGKKAQKVLLRKKARFQKQLEKTRSQLSKAQKRLKKLSLVMSRKKRAKEFAKLEQQLIQYRNQRKRLARSLAKQESKLMRVVLAKMQRVIGTVIKDNRITVMLDKEANRVLFAPDSMDYTNEVIRRYNRIYGSKKKRRRVSRRRSKR